MKRYLPGPDTRMQAGSNGAIKDDEAPSITAMANVCPLTSSVPAVFIATGSTTSAAAAFDIVCVSNIVSRMNPASTVRGFSEMLWMPPASHLSVSDSRIAAPNAVMPPMTMSTRQSITS